MTRGRTLSQDLSETSRRYGDRTAVIDGAGALTYAELNLAAERVAIALRECGVRGGDCVVWHGQRDARAVAAIHGILRAGAGYVPVDPDGPMARADTIVRLTRPTVVVADAERRDRWSAMSTGWHWLPLVTSGPAGGLWYARPAETPRARIEGLAYVLHTSGSTGVPKGVVHTQSSATAFVDWAVDDLGLSRDDVIVNSAPLHFDPSTLHLFGAARVGATVALVPAECMPFPAAYLAFCRDVGATVLYAVTSTMTWLTRRGGDLLADLDSVGSVLFGGEVIRPSDMNALLAALPRARFLNVYGPTESNICTYHEVSRRPFGDSDTVPIGRSLPGVDVLLVDDDLRPVPAGVAGEVLVAGSMMMAGYLRDEGMSRPFVNTGDGREWYATGDQAVENEAGELEFLGRRDEQIKSRGYRVELGEIERHAAACAGIEECVAVATPEPVVSNIITAFVQAETESEAAALPARLRTRVPHYMLPARTVFVTGDLPRLSNGKVDRKYLRELAARPGLDDLPGYVVVARGPGEGGRWSA